MEPGCSDGSVSDGSVSVFSPFAPRIQIALNVTAAAYERMLASETSAAALTAFIERADVTRLLFYTEGRDLVAVSVLALLPRLRLPRSCHAGLYPLNGKVTQKLPALDCLHAVCSATACRPS